MIKNNNFKYFSSYKEQVEEAKKIIGLPLYRFFPEEWQAQSLLDGKIWISTLEKCRSFEDSQQGDKEEATSTYNFNVKTGNRNPTQEEIRLAAHCGIGLSPNSFGVELNNMHYLRSIPNGFLLCTTNDPISLVEKYSGWKYGVKIDISPRKLSFFLTQAFLRHSIPITTVVKHGWAKYGDYREYNRPENQPKNLAFLKPTIHKEQSEYRFFVEARNYYIYPREGGILINCPEIIPYVSKFYF